MRRSGAALSNPLERAGRGARDARPEGDGGADRPVACSGYADEVRRRTLRITLDDRQRTPPPIAELVASSAGGVVSPGVRDRRRRERPEPGVSERIRRTLEARRGPDPGATVWRA
jgi:hypothetical protein